MASGSDVLQRLEEISSPEKGEIFNKIADTAGSVFLTIASNIHRYVVGDNGIVPEFINVVKYPLTLLTALYLIYVGAQLVIGNQSKAKECAVSCLIVLVVTSVVFNASNYNSWVIEPVVSTVIETSNWFISRGDSSTNAVGVTGGLKKIGAVFSLFIAITLNVKPEGSFIVNAWEYFQTAISICVLIVPVVCCIAAYLCLMILSLVAMHVMFILGIPCFYFVAFKETRSIFFAWLRTVINYGLIIVVASIILTMVVGALETALIDLSNLDFQEHSPLFATVPFWEAFFMSIIFFLVLLKAPDFAAAISGGFAGSTAGITGGISYMIGRSAGGIATLTSPHLRSAWSLSQNYFRRGLTAAEGAGGAGADEGGGAPRASGSRYRKR